MHTNIHTPPTGSSKIIFVSVLNVNSVMILSICSYSDVLNDKHSKKIYYSNNNNNK